MLLKLRILKVIQIILTIYLFSGVIGGAYGYGLGIKIAATITAIHPTTKTVKWILTGSVIAGVGISAIVSYNIGMHVVEFTINKVKLIECVGAMDTISELF